MLLYVTMSMPHPRHLTLKYWSWLLQWHCLVCSFELKFVINANRAVCCADFNFADNESHENRQQQHDTAYNELHFVRK